MSWARDKGIVTFYGVTDADDLDVPSGTPTYVSPAHLSQTLSSSSPDMAQAVYVGTDKWSVSRPCEIIFHYACQMKATASTGTVFQCDIFVDDDHGALNKEVSAGIVVPTGTSNGTLLQGETRAFFQPLVLGSIADVKLRIVQSSGATISLVGTGSDSSYWYFRTYLAFRPLD